jgi:Glycosyltransferase WbsX
MMSLDFLPRLRLDLLLLCAFCALLLGCSGAAVSTANYEIGVYYYPGWSPYTKGAQEPDPWAAIKRFPEREPRLGWYQEGQRPVMEQQLNWMADHAISFVVFDWYWENASPAPETAVRAYLGSDARRRVRYALLWANHRREPRTLAEWDSLTDYWLQHHLANPEYQLLDGKPVLYVFSGEMLRDQAKAMGLDTRTLLDRARSRSRGKGFAGIYFVLCVPATDYWVLDYAPKAGFDALTAYNYHFGIAGDANKRTRASESFAELDAGYQMQWDWILGNSPLPYFVPMTSGWDKRPWGGSRPPAHDNSVSTPETFAVHLKQARARLEANPQRTRRIGLICCWNEYGEGSYIEPTVNHGTAYLRRVREVFEQAPR